MLICSTKPVLSLIDTRSPIRTGCVKATSTPAPRLPSGVLSARPATTASTALDASSARAISSVCGKIERTLQAPIVATITNASRLRKLKVVRRRATTAGSVSPTLRSQAS
jgi:hypothetical protein